MDKLTNKIGGLWMQYAHNYNWYYYIINLPGACNYVGRIINDPSAFI